MVTSNLVEPCRETGFSTIIAEALEGLDKDFLRRILRFLVILEEPEAQTFQSIRSVNRLQFRTQNSQGMLTRPYAALRCKPLQVV